MLDISFSELLLCFLVALVVLGPVLLSQSRNLSTIQLGDDAAQALGVRVERTRILTIIAAVAPQIRRSSQWSS
mgnify:CR=1 FL=1